MEEFIDREEEISKLKSIVNLVLNRKVDEYLILVTGLGGIGKTKSVGEVFLKFFHILSGNQILILYFRSSAG